MNFYGPDVDPEDFARKVYVKKTYKEAEILTAILNPGDTMTMSIP